MQAESSTTVILPKHFQTKHNFTHITFSLSLAETYINSLTMGDKKMEVSFAVASTFKAILIQGYGSKSSKAGFSCLSEPGSSVHSFAGEDRIVKKDI